MDKSDNASVCVLTSIRIIELLENTEMHLGSQVLHSNNIRKTAFRQL